MTATDIGMGVLRLESAVFEDRRGRFMETWKSAAYSEYGIPRDFVQDNISVSNRHVLRGLHFQWPQPQGKLVTVLSGRVFDVAVDIRRVSPTFGRWTGSHLDGDSMHQLWIPEGFAHGFVVLSDQAIFHYKCTSAYEKSADRTIRWNDPAIGIDWPVTDPVLSDKDAGAPLLDQLALNDLPALPS